MTSRSAWSRRGALSAVLAGISAPAFGQASAAADSGAFLETAFDQAKRLTVPVRLNGQGPFDFVIDTGANKTVVSEEAALACGLPAAGSAVVHGIVSAQPARLVKLSRLRVGDVTSADMRVPVAPAAQLGAQGILGLDAMRGRRIVLGFRDKSFQIAASAQGAASLTRNSGDSRVRDPYAPVTVPARYRSGQLVILDAEAAGGAITAFLDSGSQVTVGNLALRDAVFAARRDGAAGVRRSELVSATGQRIQAEFAALADLRLGGQRLASPLAAFADLHIFGLWDLRTRPTVLIGVDVLRRFDRVAFDFSQKTVTFWPARSGRFAP